MRLLQSAVRIESNGSGSGHGSAFPDRKALPPCSCARRAKSSSHEWPRTARHGADRVSRLPGAWPACPGAAAVRGGSPHPGRSLSERKILSHRASRREAAGFGPGCFRFIRRV